MNTPCEIHLDDCETLPRTETLKVAQQVKDEQDDEHKADPATAADMTSVGIAAAAKDKNKDDNKKDECHKDNRSGGCYGFAAGEGKAASFSVVGDEGVVTVSVGLEGR